jgi:hypothetical protein
VQMSDKKSGSGWRENGGSDDSCPIARTDAQRVQEMVRRARATPPVCVYHQQLEPSFAGREIDKVRLEEVIFKMSHGGWRPEEPVIGLRLAKDDMAAPDSNEIYRIYGGSHRTVAAGIVGLQRAFVRVLEPEAVGLSAEYLVQNEKALAREIQISEPSPEPFGVMSQVRMVRDIFEEYRSGTMLGIPARPTLSSARTMFCPGRSEELTGRDHFIFDRENGNTLFRGAVRIIDSGALDDLVRIECVYGSRDSFKKSVLRECSRLEPCVIHERVAAFLQAHPIDDAPGKGSRLESATRNTKTLRKLSFRLHTSLDGVQRDGDNSETQKKSNRKEKKGGHNADTTTGDWEYSRHKEEKSTGNASEHSLVAEDPTLIPGIGAAKKVPASLGCSTILPQNTTTASTTKFSCGGTDADVVVATGKLPSGMEPSFCYEFWGDNIEMYGADCESLTKRSLLTDGALNFISRQYMNEKLLKSHAFLWFSQTHITQAFVDGRVNTPGGRNRLRRSDFSRPIRRDKLGSGVAQGIDVHRSGVWAALRSSADSTAGNPCYENVLVPMFLKSSNGGGNGRGIGHWLLGAIKNLPSLFGNSSGSGKVSLHVYDSAPGRENTVRAVTALRAMVQYIAERPVLNMDRAEAANVPLQGDGTSCGYHVIQNALRLLIGSCNMNYGMRAEGSSVGLILPSIDQLKDEGARVCKVYMEQTIAPNLWEAYKTLLKFQQEQGVVSDLPLLLQRKRKNVSQKADGASGQNEMEGGNVDCRGSGFEEEMNEIEEDSGSLEADGTGADICGGGDVKFERKADGDKLARNETDVCDAVRTDISQDEITSPTRSNDSVPPLCLENITLSQMETLVTNMTPSSVALGDDSSVPYPSPARPPVLKKRRKKRVYK